MVARWRVMATDPPKVTGRFIVAHRGGIAGHAYYTAREGETHYTVGWAQIPFFGPTHWLDAPSLGDQVGLFDDVPRLRLTPVPTKKQTAKIKARWWSRK